MFNKNDGYRKLIQNKQLEIFYHFLGDLINKSPFSSPFRIDTNPSVTLSEHKGNYYYNDFGNLTYKSLNIIDFLKEIYATNDEKLAIKQAYESYVLNIEHNTILGKAEKSDFNCLVKKSNTKPTIIVEERNWEKYDLEYWQLPQHYLTYHNIIPLKKVYYCYNDNEEETIKEQIQLRHNSYNYTYGYKYNEDYKIYKPLAPKTYKWRGYISHDTEDIDKNIIYSSYILCTSKKDRITLQYILTKLGIKHIGTISYQSETTIPEITVPLLGVMGDNDKAGNEWSNNIVNKYKCKQFKLNMYKDIFEYYIENKKELIKLICSWNIH